MAAAVLGHVAGPSREQLAAQEALPGYEISGELGRGAFGVVYAARHTQLGRDVAIKQLPRAFAADPGVRERFRVEAQLVASLDHPHIVPVYDYVDRDDGICLLIMERCQGSLSDRFAAEGLATDEACAAIIAACAALDHAHAARLLHRDIKPENLLYDTRGVVKLADFGIARALDSEARRTATGMVIGTPAYMSPEQVRGDTLTPATDVYSVAVMAYELLTGSLPFPGTVNSAGLLAHHLVTPPTPLLSARAELPAAIGAVIDRGLAKDLEVRHATAAELAEDLTRACVGSFGAGWIRRRRFVLHWPEIAAASEEPPEHGVRTGTILVKADPHLRPEIPGEAEGEPSIGQAAAPPFGPRPAAATVAPSGQRAPQPAAATVAPSRATDPPLAGPPPAGPPDPGPGGPGPVPPERSTAGRSVVVLVVAGLGAVALLVVLAAVGFFVFAAGDDDEAGPGTTVAAGPATTVAGGGETTAPATVSIPVPNLSTRPADLDITLADSPWLPTPCPEDQERVACILGGVSVDEESGEMLIPYFTEGFTPELEPPGFHIHFYLDTAVDGDERKAGSAVPGGSWKPWDGPFPFESFGGENGRSGFTLADAEAADASQVCAIVADADLEALPGTGNCAPIARYFDPDGLTAQVNRLEGRFIGRCGIGTTMIVPDGWRAVDLVTLGPAEAARDLRPTDVAAMTTTLEGLVDDGGVLWADGPVEDGFIVNLSLSRIEVDVSTASTPDEVRAALAQRGVDLAGASDRTIGGRPTLVQEVQGGDSDQLTYVTPDFGYAIVLTFTVPDASAWTEPADAMAATVQGC